MDEALVVSESNHSAHTGHTQWPGMQSPKLPTSLQEASTSHRNFFTMAWNLLPAAITDKYHPSLGTTRKKALMDGIEMHL